MLDKRLLGIIELIDSHRYNEAAARARAYTHIADLKEPSFAFLGLAAAMAGEATTAMDALANTPEPKQIRHVEVLLALGSAWFKLGDPGRAVCYLQSAVGHDATHPLGRARLGACLLAVGDWQGALPHLEQATMLLPFSGGAWLNLAAARLAKGDAESALLALDRANVLADRDAGLYLTFRVAALDMLGRHSDVEAFLRAQSEAGVAEAEAMLVNHLAARGRHDEAWHTLMVALERLPVSLPLLDLAVEFAQVRGRFGDATRLLRQAAASEPANSTIWARLALLSGRRRDGREGGEAAGIAMALTEGGSGSKRALALAAQAHVREEGGDLAGAETAYLAAISADPCSVPGLSGLGRLLLQWGRVEEATAHFETLKAIAPLQGWSHLIQMSLVPDDPEVLHRLDLAARRSSLEGQLRSHLFFVLASAWEKKGEYDRAFAYAREANEATKAHLPYRPEVRRARIEREIARFSSVFMQSRAGYGVDSELPVFVLGMPRSGTTLVEQILGGHSQVYGAGELSLIPELIQKINAWEAKLGTRRHYPECVDDLSATEVRLYAEHLLAEIKAHAPTKQRVIDKLPHNFQHIGLIKLLFPRARIVHLKRDPRDVALSNYFVDYGTKFGGMGFAYDLGWIGEQLVDHQRMMDHWHAVFPGQIMEVDYDTLVGEVEGWARRIIEYLGLDWEPGVLAFQALNRPVKTASVWQVRQTVYTSSRSRWKRFEKHLGPLEEALSLRPPKVEPLVLPGYPPGLYLEGFAHLKARRLEEAALSFTKVLAMNPYHAAACHFLGVTFCRLGRMEEGIRAMRRSVQLRPGHGQWQQNLTTAEAASFGGVTMMTEEK